MSTATAISPLASDNTSDDNTSLVDLLPQALVYDSVSRETTPAFSSSTTCLLPTVSSTSDSDPTTHPNNDSKNKPLKKSSRSTFSILLKNWKWEIAACALILAVPAVMVATLFPHAGQPTPQWPFKISINALLSIYTLVFKSAIAYVVTSCVGQLQWSWFSSGSRPLSDAVLFDEAGRSPWGLLAILWAHRLRQPLTILAAVIMIPGLAIDPFIQQLIRPFDCSIPLGQDVATLPRTNNIDSDFSPGDEDQISAYGLRSSLITGIYSSGNEIPYTCSTGNCTFPEVYSTVGICSTCEDRSTEIVVESKLLSSSSTCVTHNITTYLSSGDERYYWGVRHDQLSTNFIDACNVDQHTDVAQMDVWSPGSAEDDFPVRIDVLVGKTTFSDARRLISTGKNITGCDTAEANNTWACRGYGAASCTLKPCVRTYNATIEAGYLKERLVSRSSDVIWGSMRREFKYGLLDTQCVSAEERAFLSTRGYELHNDTRWIPFRGDLKDYNSPENEGSSEWPNKLESLLHRSCVYLIPGWFLRKAGFGNGEGSAARNPAASPFVGTVQGLYWDINESGETIVNNFGGPEILQSIYNYGRVDFGHIQGVFENISESLTKFIRTHGNASYSEPARGQVQHYAICLGIQWPWITLPAVLAVLTILFLVSVVESTGRHDTPLWKASLLPWILGGSLGVGSGNSPVGSQGQPKGGVSVVRMEDESGQILATVSEGTAPTIELVHMRDPYLRADE